MRMWRVAALAAAVVTAGDRRTLDRVWGWTCEHLPLGRVLLTTGDLRYCG